MPNRYSDEELDEIVGAARQALNEFLLFKLPGNPAAVRLRAALAGAKNRGLVAASPSAESKDPFEVAKLVLQMDLKENSTKDDKLEDPVEVAAATYEALAPKNVERVPYGGLVEETVTAQEGEDASHVLGSLQQRYAELQRLSSEESRVHREEVAALRQQLNEQLMKGPEQFMKNENYDAFAGARAERMYRLSVSGGIVPARPHIVDGEFQSDKYPTCPRGKVPLSVKDPMAQDLLWTYALRRVEVDASFSEDLMFALQLVGYHPKA